MIFELDGAWATVLGQRTSSYSAVLTLGVLLSSAILLIYARRVSCAGRVTDVLIAAIGLGLVGARAEHVLLNWPYFQTAPQEIIQFANGGLDWHGALMGAVLGGMLTARLRGADLSVLTPALTIVLPILFFTGWWACAAASCAYGAEVENLADWPSFLVWEGRGELGMIAPRFRTQQLGMTATGLVIAGVCLLVWQHRIVRWGMAGVLALLSAIALLIGGLRGDFSPMLAGIRVDQLLDLAVMLGAIGWGWTSRRSVARQT